MRAAALAIGLSGCAASPGAPPPDPPAPVDLGWVTTMAAEPGRFSALLDASSREGWIALHANDPLAALAAFEADHGASSRVGVERALLAEATLQDDLQRLVSKAARRLFDGWLVRGELPVSFTEVRALAMRCGGMPSIDPREGRVTHPAGPVDGSWIPQVPEGPWRDRLTMHVAATGAATALRAAAAAPVATIADDGFDRTLYDPCVHATLARAARDGLGGDPSATARGWADPGASLFAPWLDTADLAEQLERAPEQLGASSDRLRDALGLPVDVPATDDPDEARREVRDLDTRLAALRAGLLAGASDDSAALIEQVGLVERLRAEVLVARARRDLRAGHAQRALATLSLARDVTSRTIGPATSPALIALLAEANLDSGRAREALDALQILHAARPEVTGARELLGDLAILQGLDRHGDSKEH
jgi:hypothetical protein